jgi:Tfp pilus assembly protein PilN
MENPNLITRAPSGKPQKTSSGGLPPALVVSLIIIIFSVAVYGAFFGISILFNSRTADAQKQVAQKKTELASAETAAADALSFVSRMGSLSSLAANHTYWSGFIADLVARTDKRVQYVSLRGTEKTNTVVLEARASDYAAVERQLVSLNDSPSITKAVSKGIRYNIDPRTQIVTVNFDIQLTLVPGILKTVPTLYQQKSVGGAQ